jgi:hypothetical protein
MEHYRIYWISNLLGIATITTSCCTNVQQIYLYYVTHLCNIIKWFFKCQEMNKKRCDKKVEKIGEIKIDDNH